MMNGDSFCESVISDLRNREALKKAVLDFQPDYIFHLAAQPLVRLSYEIPSETFEVNAIGTANLLDAIKLLKKKCNIVLITTDKVYQNNEWEYPYKESDRLGGYDPYSASKACCELVIDSYKNSFFNKAKYDHHQKAIAVGRAGNVIGGGDWSKDRLIPDIAKALNANKDVVIRNPKAVRPWQHVIEPLFGYLELGLKLNLNPIKYAEAYNFGPNINDSLSVEEMAVMSINCWGSGIFNVDVSNHNPHEAGLLKLDITKAITELNWKPVLDAQTAVERTINWYKNFYTNKTALELMESDIKYYQSKINE
jgi:CDP-glucose 4,6-dehydratase